MSTDVWQSTTSILARASDRAVPKKRVEKEGHTRTKGYKLRDEAPRQNHHTLLTDAQVLECRRRHERDGEKPRFLAAAYGTSLQYMYALLSYRTRSKLIPPLVRD